MADVIIKQGEAKTLILTVKDSGGATVDLSAATLLLGVKKSKADVAYAFSKADDDFNKDQAASGIVSVALAAADTDQAEGKYIGELKCSWTGPPEVIDKSADFYIQIKEAVTS
jgi:ribosomal protein S11